MIRKLKMPNLHNGLNIDESKIIIDKKKKWYSASFTMNSEITISHT